MKRSLRSEIEENLKVGLLDIIILQLLSENEYYGYLIKQEILKRSNDKILIREGSLYGPLYRMEKKGLLTSRREIVCEKRFRIYYNITEAGREHLAVAKEAFEAIYSGALGIIK